MARLFNLRGGRGTQGRRPWERQVLIWGIFFVVGAAVVITAAYYFDIATESREFCGLLCHPNRPQYVAQEVSAHADVECGVCHVGPGLPAKVQAKILGSKELYLLVTNDVICEQCHSPEMPYEDQIERSSQFAQDETNSETQTLLLVKIDQEGKRTGAHWHIENPVWYIARDPDRQDIPWVGVETQDGQVIAYQSQENDLTADELASLPRRKMDCLDCHNRATHDFENPEDVLDQAISAGIIDRDLPYVKREAIKLLTTPYRSQKDASETMQELAAFYRTEYPDVYAARQENIAQAVATLQEIYRQTTFPEMNLTWRTYPDNIGHTDFPGCFRCHDGKHVSADSEPIPSECSLCHSVPIVVKPDREPDFSQLVSLAAVRERPTSHQDVDFIRDHRILANESCATCHGPIRYGTDNSSFCANEVCHGAGWPGARSEPEPPHPVQLVGGHAQASCIECHQGERRPAAYDDCATCHQPPTTPHLGTECATCHTPFGWQESSAAWLAVVSQIPHRADKSLDCLSCHTDGTATAAPSDHREFPGSSCLQCHDPLGFRAALVCSVTIRSRPTQPSPSRTWSQAAARA